MSDEHIDLVALDSFRFADGGGFPASYRAFVQRAGWGRSFGLWLIYPPVLPGYADGWQGRSAHLTSRFRTAYEDGQVEDFDWMIEPDGTWPLAKSLEVFGWSENGDALLWDTAARHADGEFAVWESRSLNSLHLLGANLDEALPLIRDRAMALFGPDLRDFESLPAVRL